MKVKLLGLRDAGRRKEAETIVPHVDDSEPNAAGAWTARDVVAHLGAWRETMARELEAIRTRSEPPTRPDGVDVENAQIYERTHRLPAEKVLESAAASWDRLAGVLRGCSATDLQRPYRRNPGQRMWEIVANQAYAHMSAHLNSWYEEIGQAAEAERVSSWAHDLAVEAFPDGRPRGVAEYNHGCYHARHGRAHEALPFLEKGIAYAPDLRELARTDLDLDPIRLDPEVAKLLEG